MEKKFYFKEAELKFIILELSKLPYGQVCRIINYIDNVATNQKEEEKPINEQIVDGINNIL